MKSIVPRQMRPSQSMNVSDTPVVSQDFPLTPSMLHRGFVSLLGSRLECLSGRGGWEVDGLSPEKCGH